MISVFSRWLCGIVATALSMIVFLICSALPAVAQQVELSPPVPVVQGSGLDAVAAVTESENDFAALVQRLEELESQVEHELVEVKKPAEKEKPKKKSWFEKFTISGYTQLRINETIDDRGPAALQHNGDSSIGDN